MWIAKIMLKGSSIALFFVSLSLSAILYAEEVDTEISDVNTDLTTDDLLNPTDSSSMETISDAEKEKSIASELAINNKQRCYSNTQSKETFQAQSFSICNNGNLIYDNLTGLMWTRCALGKAWDGQAKKCTGNASTFNWKESLNEVVRFNESESSHHDWRLPNVKELASIVDMSCVNPAINQSYFPDTDNSDFWSSSVFEQYPGRAWFFNFGLGNDYAADKRYFKQLRLVRLGAGESSYNLLTGKKSLLEDACASFASIKLASIKFASIVDVPLTSTIKSEQAIVNFSGKDGSCMVRIENGEYEINNNALWSSTQGTINSGDSISVRHLSSDKHLDNVVTTLNVCDASAVFMSTTLAALYEDVALDAEILFEYDSFELTSMAKTSISNYVEQYRDRFDQISEIMVIGHTDGVASQKYNQELSEQRAQSVASYIESIENTPDTDIEAIGKGKLEPIASNDTEEGRAKNRRVVMRLIFK